MGNIISNIFFFNPRCIYKTVINKVSMVVKCRKLMVISLLLSFSHDTMTTQVFNISIFEEQCLQNRIIVFYLCDHKFILY